LGDKIGGSGGGGRGIFVTGREGDEESWREDSPLSLGIIGWQRYGRILSQIPLVLEAGPVLSAACVRSFSQLTIEVIYKTSTPAAYNTLFFFSFKRCHLPENIMVDMLHMNLNFQASQKSYFKISENIKIN
jgi:hypothetical protein